MAPVLGASRTIGVLAATMTVAAAFALQLPGLAQPLGINQGIFSVAAWGLDQGLSLYRDLWDQKPPAIHLTYWLGFRLLGPVPVTVFWLDFAATVMTGVLLARLGHRLGGRLVGWTSLVAWSVLSLPALRYQAGGFLERAVPETFIAMLVPAALLCALGAARTRSAQWLTGAGLVLGIALVFKPTAAVYWLLLVVCGASAPRVDAWLRAALFVSLGTLVAPVLTSVWLWLGGSALDAWVAVVEYNRAYVAAAMGSGGTTLIDAFAHDVWRRTKTDPLWMSGMLGAAWSVITWGTRTADPLSRLLPWWLGLALVGAMGGGVRLYNAYFIPCLPPLAVLSAWAITRAWRTRTRADRVAAVIVLLAAGAVAVRTDSLGRLWSTTYADLTHAQDRIAYLERFGGYGGGRGYSARANHELVEWLRRHSSPDDRVFIFGMQGGVYFEARRLPANRFLWVGPTVEGLLAREDFTLERLAADLAASHPRFIIREANNGDSLLGWRVQSEFAKPPFQALLASYTQVVVIEDFTVYRLRGADE
jgi:4-amino-4-deoxy-L-arabinose transferase-like glycosyltransferase